jgi:glyoxylase-like metal-dependent hydrolase (beta-lactamase superfamily II)
MRIADGIDAIDFEGRVWAYVLRDHAGLMLIDAGIHGRLGLLREFVESRGDRITDVSRVVLTHFHRDHMGTAGEIRELTGARVLAHGLDAPFVSGLSPQPEPNLTEQEKQIFARVAGGIPDAPPSPVDRELSDGEQIDNASGATVLHVPGHTDGSIAVYIPDRRVVFTGDAAAGAGIRPMVGSFNVDRRMAEESFRRLASLDAEIACFGHGPPLLADAGVRMRQAAERLRAN